MAEGETDKLRRQLVAWGVSRGMPESDAEDLSQNVLVVLLEPNYRDLSAEEQVSLAFGIARRQHALWRRNRGVQFRAFSVGGRFEQRQHAAQAERSAPLDEQVRIERYRRVLAQLAPEDALIVRARLVQSTPYRAIAEAMGMSEASIRKRYSRAVLRLLEAMSDPESSGT